MDKCRPAQMLLVPFYGRVQASEVIGDLLEQRAGLFIIWSAVAGMLWRAISRWLIAFLVAMLSMLTMLHIFEALRGIHKEQSITSVPGIGWLTAGLCSWSVLVLNSIRFGWKHRINLVSLVVTLSLCMLACCAGTGYQRFLLVANGCCLVGCLLLRHFRAPMACLLLSAACYAAVFLPLAKLVHLSHSRASWYLLTTFVGTWLLSFMAQGFTLSQLRERAS